MEDSPSPVRPKDKEHRRTSSPPSATSFRAFASIANLSSSYYRCNTQESVVAGVVVVVGGGARSLEVVVKVVVVVIVAVVGVVLVVVGGARSSELHCHCRDPRGRRGPDGVY
jgi:hypothetical protein